MIRLHGLRETISFISEYHLPTPSGPLSLHLLLPAPVFPSIVSCLVGLVFYITHFPECLFAAHVRAPGGHSIWSWMDRLGGGSHAIWHALIVLGISQYRGALDLLEGGVGGVLAAGQCLVSSQG